LNCFCSENKSKQFEDGEGCGMKGAEMGTEERT
jgi:hypothetical protein